MSLVVSASWGRGMPVSLWAIAKEGMRNATIKTPYWATWVWDSQANPKTYDLVKRYMHRPSEQLYRTVDDPFEMANLAGDKEHTSVRDRLAQELDRWMVSQGDPGIPQDAQESIDAARRGQHRFFPPATP